ncbi:MAG TPA: hypothetical protein VHV77_16580 [Pirellulales bacterium]|jgi:hypothetical protein|nr:hypothetical protein [Pirellulales bacterium]
MLFQRITPVVLSLALFAAGCAPPSSEPSLIEQAAFVRSGDTDEIVIQLRPVTDAELDVLKSLTGLRVLLLDNADNRITDTGMETIATLANLEHLRIRGGAIGDAGLEALTACKHLRILNLPRTQATDCGLAKLERLPKLEQLRVGSPAITDLGVKELKGFPALRQVHLIDVPLTDVGLTTFSEMPDLESLYVDGALVTDEGYEALFQARPKLHVHIDQQHHDRDPHAHRHEN